MINVYQREAIRRAYFIEQKSIRQIARDFGHSRKTVRKALADPEAQPYTLRHPRPAPVLGAFKARIEALLADNVHLPRKQRYTARRIFQRLRAQGYKGSESSVRRYVSQLRARNKKRAVFLPLEFDPGIDAQVDWGEAEAIISGKRQTVQLFVMRLCYSRRLFVMAAPSQRQEVFFDAHVRAFAAFGGVPHRITYDNLTTAVARVLEGRNREEQRSFIVFRSYYLFDSRFCTPGQGHEKGGVEHGVGFVRRNFLVPVPEFDSFEALNTYLAQCCLRDQDRQVKGQPQRIGQAFAQEQPMLRPLPERPFEAAKHRPARLNPYRYVSTTLRHFLLRNQTRIQVYCWIRTVGLWKYGQPLPCHRTYPC